MQIYWGVVPFVLIQIVMVGLIIAFPGIVTGGLDKAAKIDLNKVMQQMNKEFREQAAPAAAEPPSGGASALVPEGFPNPAEEQQSEADEQKKIDDLFKK
jgi:GntP family gluconate:H+ symporter